MIMSGSRGTLGFLIYALLVQCSASSPLRLETAAYDEDGTSLADMAFDSEQIALRSSPSGTDDVYEIFSPPEKRTERHADGMFNKAYRQALGQLSARKYLHSLMAKRVGGGSAMEEAEALAKRHSDGVFTDSYSRYRKQMAVRKYLAAVLGKSPEDLDLHQFLQGIDIGELPDGDEFEAFMSIWLRLLVSGFAALVHTLALYFLEKCLSLFLLSPVMFSPSAI
ncbi:adenylate cyclase activating polypeptide 1a isoform X1 [Hemibagrus wyckioides]|uniref:adenylate cyclase activating polypeptide 1a isoform X1 n=1 Tax=Hemibagrus wyckioides TaxID=337641 RepID=UPI00266BBBB9|nr:adenylate cyclase activating polypeptide 1a isoform X1 [Hemibagrus wyckioides]XP_058249990.1 adenylate cyclase activating polypeptide 1a isoform X1 [Hemibagrus wyckioides]